MTTAETVQAEGARTEIVRVHHLQRGVVVIDDETGARSMVSSMQPFEQATYVWFTNEKHASWHPEELVTVLAVSLPSTYWIAKYERLQTNVAELAAELAERARQVAGDRTQPPVSRAAHSFEAHHSARQVEHVLDVTN